MPEWALWQVCFWNCVHDQFVPVIWQTLHRLVPKLRIYYLVSLCVYFTGPMQVEIWVMLSHKSQLSQSSTTQPNKSSGMEIFLQSNDRTIFAPAYSSACTHQWSSSMGLLLFSLKDQTLSSPPSRKQQKVPGCKQLHPITNIPKLYSMPKVLRLATTFGPKAKARQQNQRLVDFEHNLQNQSHLMMTRCIRLNSMRQIT